MERRMVLGALLAGAPLAAGAARAQATASPAPAAPGSGPSDAARAHMRDTMAVGARSLVVSRIARDKLRHPMTKQFADFEVAEQEVVTGVLEGRLTPGSDRSGAIRPPSDAEVEAALDDDGRAAASKFRDMAAGPQFEKDYVQAQVDGHKALLGIQDRYLQAADDPAEVDIAELVRGRVREHLVILGDIARHLG